MQSIIEQRSIDYVPWSERHGKVWHQGPFWFTSNFVLFTLAVGFTGPLGGLGLGWTTVAVALGGIVGAASTRMILTTQAANDVIPLQLGVCTAVGVITALLTWIALFR